MSDDLKTAKEAHEEAAFLFEKAPKKFKIEYIYHWNRLLVYLQRSEVKEAAR